MKISLLALYKKYRPCPTCAIGVVISCLWFVSAIEKNCPLFAHISMASSDKITHSEPKEDSREGAYHVEGHYIWDSWLVAEESTKDGEQIVRLFRYALTAPKSVGSPEKRHNHAKVRCAVSTDSGKSWEDKGVVLEPRTDGEWPNLVIWTSHAMILNEQWYM